jgi:outer membrane immunogenic protein
MKLISRLAGLLMLASIAGAASAQDVIATVTNQWEGFYAGGNIGGGWNNTCNSWQVNNAASAAIQNVINARGCPNNGTFIGGVMLGYNFQYNEWVWGFGLDYEIWSGKTRNSSYNFPGYTNPTPPPAITILPGTATASLRGSPNGIFIVGPRVGYAVDNWLPYFRIGGVFTSGSHNSTLTYTDANGTASWSGGKNFKNSGFGAGVGTDLMIVDQLFFRAEYNYISLGKGSATVTQCTGTPATCNEFGVLQLSNFHNKFTANLFRVGLAYKF